MGKEMQDLSSSGPNGAMMPLAAKTPQALRYVFSDVWNGLPSTAGLPVELWPYVTAHRVFATGPPSAGIWKTGQVVWLEVHKPALYENGSIRVATFPEYEPFQEWEEQAPGAPLGWMCANGGEPGHWVAVTGEQQAPAGAARLDAASVAVAAAVAGGGAGGAGGGDGGGGSGGDEERVALREELAELRQVVHALVGRVVALEAK